MIKKNHKCRKVGGWKVGKLPLFMKTDFMVK